MAEKGSINEQEAICATKERRARPIGDPCYPTLALVRQGHPIQTRTSPTNEGT